MHRWRRFSLIALAIVLLGGVALISIGAISSVPIPLVVRSIDGTVSGVFNTIRFTNGSIVNDGSGVATVTVGVGNASGDINSATASTADGQLTVFSGVSGKIIDEYAGGAGILKTNANGVPAPAVASDVDTLLGAPHLLTTRAENGLSAGVNLGALSTGLLKITVNAGAATPSIAAASDVDTLLGAPHVLTTQAETGLSAASNLGALSTGLVKITVAGGVATPATALAGTDFQAPLAAGVDYATPAALSAAVSPKADAATTITGSAPLGGGGSLAANRTLTCVTCTTNAAALLPDQPVIGSGANAVRVGTVSGTTTRFGTVSTAQGATTTGKQVVFDASGNLTASAFDAGSAQSTPGVDWGDIGGTLSEQLDLQAALNAKVTGTLSTDANLGTSDTTVSTQYAIKQYVDAIAAQKQATITPGSGLSTGAGNAWITASTEPDFLHQGGTTDLTAGANQGGKMQVLDSGRLQYTAGSTPTLYSGYLLPSPLTWNVTALTCTGDGNAGKLTVNGSNQVVCAADLGGTGGAGTVQSITATAPLHVTGDEITTAGDITIDNALADGSTKGVATFGTGFATSTPGIVTLNYGAMQVATNGQPGLLSAADHGLFAAKQDALGFTAVNDLTTVNGHRLNANVTVTKSDLSLGSVTNDAQLKRSADDWTAGAGISQKASPTLSDKLLIEDQASVPAGAKKYVLINDLPGYSLTVRTTDGGTIVTHVTTINVGNGDLSDDTGGVVTIATGGGGGGTGDVTSALGANQSAVNQLTVFADVNGKTITGSTNEGVVKLTSGGVVSTVAAPSGALVGTTDSQRLSGKYVALRRQDTTSNATTFPACNVDSYDMCTFVSQAAVGTITIPMPTGTPDDGQLVQFRLTCTAGQTYSFDSSFYFLGDIPQPLTCPAGTTDYWAVKWNAVRSTYDVVTVVQETGLGGGATGGLAIAYAGTLLTPQQPRLNFTGAGVSCAPNTGTGSIDCSITGLTGSAYDTIEKDGAAPVAQKNVLHVIGGALGVADGGLNNRTELSLSQSPASATAVVGTSRLLTINGTGSQIAITGSPAQDLTSDPSWTLSIPNAAELNVAKLTNLTTNGLVMTSSGTGTLSVLPATSQPAINAKVYGALGYPASADDTAALQAAINASTGAVDIPPGTYRFTQLSVPKGILLRGAGSVWSSPVRGTVLEQIDVTGTGQDAIVLQCTDDAYFHGGGLRDLHLRKLSGSTDTVGSGVVMGAHPTLGTCHPGEGMILEHLFVEGFPEDGVKLAWGSAPLVLRDIHPYTNGAYGLDIDASGHAVTLDTISGDDNVTALIRVHDTGGYDASSVRISNVKAERSPNQPVVILLDNLLNGIAYIDHVSVTKSAGSANVADIIKLVTARPFLQLQAITCSSACDNLINDTVGSVTIPYDRQIQRMIYSPTNAAGYQSETLGGYAMRSAVLGANQPPIASSATAGLLTQKAGANGAGVTMQTLTRNTDSSPQGNFATYEQADGTDLWNVDITGTLTVGSVPAARISTTLGASQLPNLNLVASGLTPSRCVEVAGDGTLTVAAAACGTGGGNVSISGTPADNRLAVWTNATTIEGPASLTWDGTTLGVGAAGAASALTLSNTTSGVLTLQAPAGVALGQTVTLAAATGTVYPNVMSAAGDLTYGGASGVPTRLAAGSTGLLKMNGSSAPTVENAANVKTFLSLTAGDVGLANATTSASNGTLGNLVKYAGNDKTVATTSIADTDVVTASAAYGASGRMVLAGGNNKTTSSSTALTADADGLTSQKETCASTAIDVNPMTARCYLVDTSGGNVTLTLPNAAMTNNAARLFRAVKTTSDSNQLILAPATGDSLNFGDADASLQTTVQGEGFEIVEQDGASAGNWLVTQGIKVTGGTTNFLREDGTWQAPPSGGAPTTAHYLTTQAETGLSAESDLGSLSSGMLSHSVSGGVSTPAAISSTTVGQVLRVTGSNTFAFGAVDLADTDAVTGILPNGNTSTGLRRRICAMDVGSDNAPLALVDADIGPQNDWCLVPAAATIVEVVVKADGGTPSALPRKTIVAGTHTSLLSGALATAASGARACSRAAAETSYDGATSCTNTLTTTTLAAGDSLGLTSGTAGGTAKRMSVWVVYELD